MATTKKAASKKSTRKTPAKKSPAKKTATGQACWPGYKRKPGTTAGAKGSCVPKTTQTKSEKKGDSKAAAARKREKTGHD